jgi:hypothetical protein
MSPGLWKGMIQQHVSNHVCPVCAHVDRVGQRDSVVECRRGASGRKERRYRRYHQSVHVNEHHIQVDARPLPKAAKGQGALCLLPRSGPALRSRRRGAPAPESAR